MEFLDFSNGKGALSKDFDFKNLLKRVEDDKFLQQSLVFVDDATIKRVLKSKKILIGEAIVADTPVELNMEFGTLNKDKGYECYYDLCAKNLIFYVIKNQVDGNEILELCAVSTLTNENGGFSTSLYYIPEGDFSNLCMVARICHHQGTNDHKNSNGNIIGRNELHIHLQTESYIEHVKEKYKNNHQKLILSLQSPDAFVLNKECKNVRQLADIATEMFNITYHNISFIAESKQDLYSEIKQSVDEFTF